MDNNTTPAPVTDAGENADLYTDAFIKGRVTPQQPQQSRGYINDIATSIPIGAGSLVNSLANIGSGITGTDLQDRQDVESQTIPGSLAKVVTQAYLGGRLLSPIVGESSKALGASKAIQHTLTGAAIDFTAFDGKGGRLSDLIEEHAPSLSNPVTEYLSSKPDDNWAEARLKNAIEGAGVGYVAGAVFNLVGLKKAAALGDKELYAEKLKAAQSELDTVAKAEELRSQIKEVAPQITDDQIDHSLTLHILVGKELGRSAEESLAKIKEVVAHDGSSVEDIQKALTSEEVPGQARIQRTLDNVAAQQSQDATAAKTAADAQESAAIKQNLKQSIGQPVAQENIAEAVKPGPEVVPVDSPDKGPQFLGSTDNSGVTKGYTRFISDTQAIIGLHSSADVSTFLHESFHMFRRFGLASDTEVALKRSLGMADDAIWNRETEEKAARLFERWWTDGQAPNDQLKPMFQSAREWMLGVYHTVDSPEIAAPVSPEVKNVFANMLGAAPLENGPMIGPVEKSAAEAQAKLMSNDPAIYLGQKQGRPLKDSVVQDIKTTVTQQLKDGQTWDNVERGMSAYLNLSKINAGTDVKSIIQQVQDALSESVKNSVGTLTNAQLEEAAKAYANEIGTTSENALKALKSEASKNANLPIRILAGRMVRNQFAEELTKAAKLVDANPGSTALIRQADDKWKAYANAAKYAKAAQVDVARALNSFNIKAGGIDSALESKFANIQKLLDANPDSTLAKRLFYKQVVAAGDPGAIGSLVDHLNKRFESFGKKALSLHDEMWINALLSGPRTQLTNVISQSMMTAIMPAERIVGGLLSGDLAMASRGVKLYANLVGSALDVFNVGAMGLRTEESSMGRAWQALRNEQPVLDNSVKFAEGPRFAWSAQALGAKEGTFYASALDTIGKAIRLPTRLLTGMDEFFKQINYRAYLRDELMDEAQRLGLKSPEEVGAFMQKGFKDGFTDSGKATYSPALLMAKRATFTQDLVEGSISDTISKAASKHPLVRNIVPFVKVPTNILKTSLQYTPGLNLLSQEFRNELTHADSAIRASAYGRLALGGAFWTAAYGFAASGNITGNGPSDPKLRQQKMDAGWQPLSIVSTGADGKKTYTSFKRLEPFAMILGLVADYHEAGQWMDQDSKNGLATAMAMSVAKNLTNKTYLKGLSDILDALQSPDSKGEKWLQSRLGSEIPYSGLLGQLNDDPNLHETRTFMDGVLSRLPGYSINLPPKRNLFGKPITNPYGISPFTQTESVSDPVSNELANLRYGFGPPSRDYRGIDLTTLKNAKGQDAWDRLQELHGQVQVGGKTLDQALQTLITSPRYQAYSPPRYAGDQQNPRVQDVQETISRYRERATRQMLREYPQIGQQDKVNRKAAVAMRITPALARLTQQ